MSSSDSPSRATARVVQHGDINEILLGEGTRVWTASSAGFHTFSLRLVPLSRSSSSFLFSVLYTLFALGF